MYPGNTPYDLKDAGPAPEKWLILKPTDRPTPQEVMQAARKCGAAYIDKDGEETFRISQRLSANGLITAHTTKHNLPRILSAN